MNEFSTPPRLSGREKLSIGTPATDVSSPMPSPSASPSGPERQMSFGRERKVSIHSLGSSPRSPSSGKLIRHSSSFLLGTNAIGSSWSVEITCLKQSATYFEAAECLRRLADLLNEVDRPDRLRFCKPDFEKAVSILRKKKQLWSEDLFRDVNDVYLMYFHRDPFRKLASDIVMEIFWWLPIQELHPVISVCWEWSEVCCSNVMWQQFYHRKFLVNNPGRSLAIDKSNYMESFRSRLYDPHVGDKVEVAWRGKFRLETQDVYQGLAWWVAEVVDKNKRQGRYKIRYPGWESRWDEWVPLQRLRWTVSRNTIEEIKAGDAVELWCCGANVPGAWLECKVKRVRTNSSGTKYCIARVLQSGHLWVERERLRLVHKSPSSGQATPASSGSPSSPSVRRSMSNLSFSLLSSMRNSIRSSYRERFQSGDEDIDTNSSCAIS